MSPLSCGHGTGYFTFLVGEQKHPVTAYAPSIAVTSEPMHALIHNGMRESVERSATILDIQVDDFARFVEYAYTKDYTPPLWDDEPDAAFEPTLSLRDKIEHAEAEKSAARTQVRIQCPRPLCRRMVSLRDAFTANNTRIIDPGETLQKAVTLCCQNCATRFLHVTEKAGEKAATKTDLRKKFVYRYNETRTWAEKRKDRVDLYVGQGYTSVLMAHIRLYIFAQIWMVEELKDLILVKVHAILVALHLDSRHIEDFVDIISYVYESLDLPELGLASSRKNGLKELLLEFVICEYDEFVNLDGFKDLLHDGGELSLDLWRLTTQYFD